MPLTDALELYRRGLLAEAESVCQDVLREQPWDFGALHLLGVIALRCGRADQAIACIGQAVTLRPDSIEARNNLGAALRALGRAGEAIACYDAAISQRPDHAESHYNRGSVLRELGRSPEALTSYDTAIALRPDFAPAHFHRGNLLRELKDLPGALAAFDRVIALNSDFAEAYYIRGNVLRDLGRREVALASYDQAIARRPDHAQALNNRGNVLRDTRRTEEALANYDKAIAARPDFAEAHYNRGTVLRELGRPADAVASYDLAIVLKPAFAEAHNNRGNALRDLDRLEAALESYANALSVRPDYAEAWYSRGAVLWDQGDPEAALTQYDQAIALKPDMVEAQYNKGICHLALGDYERGWRGFEWRWKSRYIPLRNDLPGAAWIGDAPIEGKTILVYAEQGFGDSLQLCRYVPLLAERASVVLQVPRPLLRLFANLKGVTRTVAEDEPPPPFDAWIPMMSLPLAFRSTLATTPREVPYLRADPERTADWLRRLTAFPGRKVGLAWAGSPLRGLPRAEAMNRRRSMPLAQYAPLGAMPGHCFVSLQKGEPATRARTPPPGMVLHDWTDELNDFADTAALVEALDLVITVDTAVAHLAGALGKPVWVLNRYDQCWRWLRGRTDSPWYPTAHLFRQRSPGDWAGVIDDVARALSSPLLEDCPA